MDIEITDICRGPGRSPCLFCYKGNTPKNSHYMSLGEFKRIFSRFKKEPLTQIAFGVDAQCESNPDTFAIMQHARENGIIPNVTVADINDYVAFRLSKLCGAVAVSRYANKDFCYNSIERLASYKNIYSPLEQITIHIMISQETLEQVYETFYDYKTDPRLSNLNAIVLLSLKKKGRGKQGYTPLTQEQFNDIVNYALEHNIPIGFDSCSCGKFEKSINTHKDKDRFMQLAEPCESSLFSFYINTLGQGFPCSFVEGEGEWAEGIDMFEVEDFLSDVWYNERLVFFRSRLLENKRECPIFEV